MQGGGRATYVVSSVTLLDDLYAMSLPLCPALYANAPCTGYRWDGVLALTLCVVRTAVARRQQIQSYTSAAAP
jgi:hypothetical protein